MRSINMHSRDIAHHARNTLLDNRQKSLILVAEDIGARHELPWLVGGLSGEDGDTLCLELGYPSLLFGGRDVGVEDFRGRVGSGVVALS